MENTVTIEINGCTVTVSADDEKTYREPCPTNGLTVVMSM